MIKGNDLASLFGSAGHIAAERGIAEFRSGRPVLMVEEGRAGTSVRALYLPVDGLSDEDLAAFRHLVAPSEPCLVVAARRARALGLDSKEPVALALGQHDSAATILALAAKVGFDRRLTTVEVPSGAGAALELAKLAQRLPALLVAKVPSAPASEVPLVEVTPAAVMRFRKAAIDSLNVASEANVPLADGLQTRFVIFRDAIGGSSVAVIVGTPDFSRPVPVRLHSACLTGDVFGSRRCDCGDQLRLALSRLDAEGGGVVLYLDQEGRGLGLANKMRTYELQDAGLDTIDANATLGFDDDERDYGAAARMLEVLGCKQVKLLTNNPSKLEGLTEAGIEVVGRIPLHGPVNADNRRYLTAKAVRAGHKLDHVLGVLPAAGESPPERKTGRSRGP